jgi:N-formylmaleamate deformylase
MTLLSLSATRISVSLMSVLLAGSIASAQTVTGMPRPSAPNVAHQDNPAVRAAVVGHGRPMVLISGLISGPEVWGGLIEHYKGTYEMHVLTLAGFAGVPSSASADFIAHERDGIIEYITSHRLQRPVIVGHSLGGYLAYAVATTAPQLVGPVVSLDGLPFGAALMDTTATPERVRGQAAAIRAAFARLTPNQVVAQLRPAFAQMMHDSTHLSRVMAWAAVSDPATVGDAMAGMMATDLRPGLAAIQTPILQIGAVGAYPAALRATMPARYEAQVAQAPRHRVAISETAFHFVMLDDVGFVVQEMNRFLAAAATDRR